MDLDTAPLRPAVGFAGLGAMGFGMASNLLKGGFDVTGFDVNPLALENLIAAGGRAAQTVRAASQSQQYFFIMVATPEQVDMVMFGDEGICSSLPIGAIVCLFSTLPPSYVTALPGRLAAQGRADIALLDCPVSGGAIGAINGTLSVS
jgi:3-hydroxyisobutyrate dehydrogenase